MTPVDLQSQPEVISGTRHLDDAQFVASMEASLLSPDHFRHFDHVRLAWLFLRADPLEAATERMVRVIRAFAIRHTGSDAKYHDTLTRLWMRVVAIAMAKSEEHEDFAGFVAAHPYLFDKGHTRVYYSESRLMSAEARAGWIEPDLRPLTPVRCPSYSNPSPAAAS